MNSEREPLKMWNMESGLILTSIQMVFKRCWQYFTYWEWNKILKKHCGESLLVGNVDRQN